MHMFMDLSSGFYKIMFILLEKPIAFYMRHVIIWVRVPGLQRPVQGLIFSFGGWGLLSDAIDTDLHKFLKKGIR